MGGTLLLCMLAGQAAGVALDPKSDQPYEVVVYLRFSDDPGFTRPFIGSVRRQVRDQLANYFGTLAGIRVVAESALFDDLDEGGLRAVLSQAQAEALAALREKLTAAGLDEMEIPPGESVREGPLDKVFLVTVDFDGGTYGLRWRQFDGDVGQLGPLYSRITPDRQWVAKAICLAVKEDFAPVACFVPDEHRQGTVRLEFRGLRRSPRLEDGTTLLRRAWLADGRVLQPFWVIRRGDGGLVRQPIPHTLLRIEGSKDGTRATVVSSLPDPLKRTARVAGFQAIKLTTRTGRFRLQLVDAETGAPVLDGSAMVYADGGGFEQIEDADLLLNHDRQGYVVAEKPFPHVAYIKISSGGTSDVKIALPITDDWCEHVCRLRIDGDAAARGKWKRDLSMVVSDLQVLQAMIDEYVREVNDYNQNKQYEQARQRTRLAIGSLRKPVETAGSDLRDLKVRAGPMKMSDNALLVWADGQVEEIRRRQKQLDELAAGLTQTIDQVGAQSRANVLIQLAAQAEQAGELDEAISKYRLALKEWPKLPGVQRHLDELEATWTVKHPEHENARRFVYTQWAKAPVRDLEGLLPAAKRAFAVLRQVDDHLTTQKLMKVTGGHLRELTDVVNLLAGRSGDADRKEMDKYGKLTEEVAQFQLQVGTYLTARAEGRPPEPVPAGAGHQRPAPKDQPAKTPTPDLEEEEEEPLQPSLP